MKKNLSTLLVIAEIFLAGNLYSQWQPSWNVGAGIGGGAGVNEAITQSFNPQIHVYALWLNGILPHLSLESGFGVTSNSSPDQGHYSEYFTNLVPIDLRLRYAPLGDEDWQPYVYAGIGLLSYSVTSAPPNTSADAKLSGVAGYLPVGIGLYHPFSNNFAADFQIGENPSFSDNLNPVHDNRNDAFWTFSIGLTYSFGGENSPLVDDDYFGPRGSIRILNTVAFDSGTSRLKKESENELAKILAALDSHTEIDVEFRSYTDDSGDFNTNMALTHDRAESVKIWFVTRGIPETRISTQGYGPHNPIVQNDTPEHRKQNCRIEVVRMK